MTGSSGGFGSVLRRSRLAVQLTQEELAARSGLSTRTVRDLEGGRVRHPRARSVRLLADALGLDADAADRLVALAREGYWQDRADPAPADPAPADPAPAELPPAPTDLTGRDAEATGLRDLLGRGPAPVVVSGPPGIGKTALAVHVAHALRPRFPDGQLYARLGGADPAPVPAADLAARFLRALGVDGSAVPADLDERAALLRSRTAELALLLVLDDAAGEDQVRPLLPAGSGCAVVVTSRRRLPGLEGAAAVELGLLADGPAGRLLAGIAGADRLAAEPAATGQVLTACAGLPLALRIAGARLAAHPGWPVARLADRLADSWRRLDELHAGDLAVRGSIGASLRALDPEARRAYRRLGLLAPPPVPAWVVAALLDVPVERAEALVERLADAALLELTDTGPDGDRHRMHDLVRLHAAERVQAEESPAERAAALARVAGAWLDLVGDAVGRLSGSRLEIPPGDASPWPVRPVPATLRADPLRWLDREVLALVGAVRVAAEAGAHGPARALAAVATDYFALRGLRDEWQRTARSALAAAEAAGDRAATAAMLHSLGECLVGQDELDEAGGVLARAAALYAELGDAAGETRVALGALLRHLMLGEVAAAEARLRLATERSAAAGDRRGSALAAAAEGFLLRELGRPAEGRDRLRAALAEFRALGDRYAEADVTRGLGHAYRRAGETGPAVACYRRALELFTACGDPLGVAYCRMWEAITRADEPDQAEVAELLARAGATFDRLGDQYGHAFTTGARARLDRRAGRLAEAERLLAETVAYYDRRGMAPHRDRDAAELAEVRAERASAQAG